MRKSMRWMVPVTAAVALMAGLSAVSARAADDAKASAGKGNVSGTVVDKDGKGVEGVEVRLMKPFRRGGPGGPGGGGGEGRPQRPQDQATHNGPGAVKLQEQGGGAGGAGGQRQRPEPVATATTDKDGKFEMKDVPAGDYMVGVRDQEKKVYGMSRVTVKDGETATVEIKTSDTPPQRGGRRGGGAGGAGGAGGGGEQK